MDNRQILMGTVRGIDRDRAVVRCPDGRGFVFRLLGKTMPALGEDVIGRVGSASDGTRTLDLSAREPSINADVTISFFGDPRLAAHLLLRHSSGAAAYSPGHADTIRRTHRSRDPDLDWALRAMSPEADRENVALNVIDVRALAGAPWAKETISDLLPSDTCDDPVSTEALLDCLRSGFAPTTRMILEPSMNQESCEFIVPYNPTAGGFDFIRREAGAARRHWPRETVPAAAARRISSARQMALSLASRILPVTAGRGDDDLMRAAWRSRVAHSFADAAAALAWRRSGGDPDVIDVWTRARTAASASLADATSMEERAGILSTMTADAIAATSSDSGGPLLREAAMIAVAACRGPEDPANRVRMLELAWNGALERDAMFVDCDAASPEMKAERRTAWLSDLADVMTHLGDEPLALDRLATVGRASVPMGFQRVFDLEMEAVGVEHGVTPAPGEGLDIEALPPPGP